MAGQGSVSVDFGAQGWRARPPAAALLPARGGAPGTAQRALGRSLPACRPCHVCEPLPRARASRVRA